jgi:hypothetical protein
MAVSRYVSGLGRVRTGLTVHESVLPIQHMLGLVILCDVDFGFTVNVVVISIIVASGNQDF